MAARIPRIASTAFVEDAHALESPLVTESLTDHMAIQAGTITITSLEKISTSHSEDP